MSNSRKRRSRPANATGRSADSQYMNLGYPLVQSPAWRSLGGPALKVLMELRSRYTGGNNGRLTLSFDEAARLLHLGKATVGRALEELQAKGFLIETRHGHWYGRRATEWALTLLPQDGMPATHNWKRWAPPQKTKSRFPCGPMVDDDGSAWEPRP